MPNACWLTLTPTCAYRVGCLGAVLARFEDLPRDRWLDRDGTAEVRDVGSCPRVGPEAAAWVTFSPGPGCREIRLWGGMASRYGARAGHRRVGR